MITVEELIANSANSANRKVPKRLVKFVKHHTMLVQAIKSILEHITFGEFMLLLFYICKAEKATLDSVPIPDDIDNQLRHKQEVAAWDQQALQMNTITVFVDKFTGPSRVTNT